MTPVTGPKRVPSADWVMAHFGASDCDPKSLADAKRETRNARGFSPPSQSLKGLPDMVIFVAEQKESDRAREGRRRTTL